MKKETKKEVKDLFLIFSSAILILVIVVGIINILKLEGILVGKAVTYMKPIQIYGEIIPGLPNGTKISFKVDDLEIASTELKDSKYGYEPELFFKTDDPLTPEKEGYIERDSVKVYIEDVEIAEISYFKEMPRNLEVPASKRIEISNKIAEAILLCIPEWECGEWSECVDFVQTRTCVDKNACRIESGKPAESRSCVITPEFEVPFVEEEKKIPWNYISAAIIVIICIWFIVYGIKEGRRRGRK